tara:strand:- start:17470 stop:17655 length:186 start_codon:yes stop_codon:yes gene_type:complete
MSDTPKNSDSQGTAAINTKKIAKMISLTNNKVLPVSKTKRYGSEEKTPPHHRSINTARNEM